MTRQPDREERQRRRAAASEDERRALDRAFHEAFIRATGGAATGPRRASPRQGEPEALPQLRALLAQGAGTSAFEDYELSPEDNFGTVVKNWLSKHWLSKGSRPTAWDAAVAEALELCVAAGPAFATNRGYVGNGGVPAIWFVFEWFREPEEERVPWVRGLLEAMCAAAEPSSPFWREFLGAFLGIFLEPLGRAQATLSESQGQVARFGLRRILQPELSLANGVHADEGAERARSLFRGLLGLAEPGLFDLVLELAEAKAGLFARLPNPLPFESAEPLLKGALRDERSRGVLADLIRRSQWLRDAAFACPELLFSLVRRRERKLLEVFLSVDLERARALRDAEGNDLLLSACGARGRTERLVELLLRRGFDPARKNARGERALDRATQTRNRKLIALLTALEPPRAP